MTSLVTEAHPVRPLCLTDNFLHTQEYHQNVGRRSAARTNWFAINSLKFLDDNNNTSLLIKRQHSHPSNKLNSWIYCLFLLDEGNSKCKQIIADPSKTLMYRVIVCSSERKREEIKNKKLIRRWDSERELSLPHRTRTTKYGSLLYKFRHRSRFCVITREDSFVHRIQCQETRFHRI